MHRYGSIEKITRAVVITRLGFLRFYPRSLAYPRTLCAYERKHASPARVTYETSAYETYLDIPFPPPPSSSFSLPSGCLYYLKARIFSDYPTQPSFSSRPSVVAASLFLTIRENRGSVASSFAYGCTRFLYIRARTRVATLVSSLLAKWPSPVHHHGRPRTPSAANLSLAYPSLP